MISTLRNKGLKHMLNTNQSVSKVAQVLDISLKSGEANLKISLKGETEPIHLSLNYAFKGNTLCVSNVKANKEWVNALAELSKDHYSEIDLSKHGKFAGLAKYLF